MSKTANPAKSREKLFIGGQLRQIRTQMGMTQAAFAARLGVSPSYMNQLEHDQRPVSAAVLMQLTTELGVDLQTLSASEFDRMAGTLGEALGDPLYDEPTMPPRLVRHLAGAAPELARAFLKAHALNKRYEERLQALDSKFDTGAPEGDQPTSTPLPYDEVRDYFHERNNYVDLLDRAAEKRSMSHELYGPSTFPALADYLKSAHGLSVAPGVPEESSATIYSIDRATNTVRVNSALAGRTLSFQIAAIIGLIEQEDAIDALVEQAGFQSSQARGIAKLALANYYAGALLMPYGWFARRAVELRHDIEMLQYHFGVSFEQACHRLSNLQRPGAAGLPFYFVRVDRAGNITKRHSATKLQFARFGGSCPLWNVHEAFTVPGRIFVQLAETPDGTRFLSIARSIVKRAGRFDGFDRHFAVGLGCEVRHAGQVIYGDGLDLDAGVGMTPIGVSCRICERADCPQRAFPPFGREISTDPSTRRFVPYSID